MDTIQLKNKYIEMKDAMKVMATLVNDGEFVIHDKYWEYRTSFEFYLRINNLTNIKVVFDIKNNEIRLKSNIATIDDPAQIETAFNKINAKPKYIDYYRYYSSGKYSYKVNHCFKITKNNIERMYRIFNFVLTLSSK